MPVQALLVRFYPAGARVLPNWYHRQVCRLIGLRLGVSGRVDAQRPSLLVANHSSWLDIPVLSAVAPVSFVAKQEVGRWPFVSSLARLQRTVFVDRQRRQDVDQTTTEIIQRLRQGDNILLFAEGTSSDGNRVLPFKTSLFAAVKPPARLGAAVKDGRASDATSGQELVVQTISVVYTKLHGVPFSRRQRSIVGWYGDMEMQGHAWALLKAGPIDVDIRVSPPVPLSEYVDRKALAKATEALVRQDVVAALRGLLPGERPIVVEADRRNRHKITPDVRETGGGGKKKWV